MCVCILMQILQTTICRYVYVYYWNIISIQDSPAGLLEFERVTATTKENILSPQWTAVIPLPDHCTPEQTEASVMQLVEVRSGQAATTCGYQ